MKISFIETLSSSDTNHVDVNNCSVPNISVVSSAIFAKKYYFDRLIHLVYVFP